MTTTMPSRAAIDRAEPLDFPDRRPKAEPLTITVHAVVAGFATELCFTGSIDQLPALAARLVALGATPTSKPATHTAPLNGSKPKAERVTPAYDGDGQPICPTHKKALKEGKWGLYCSAKDRDTDEYCRLKFAE